MGNALQKYEIAAAFDNETVLTRLILKAFIETLAMKSQPPTSLAQNALLQNQQAMTTEVKSQLLTQGQQFTPN